MFVVGISYIPLLQAVVARCKGVLVEFICEVADDGVVLVGIELDVPFVMHSPLQRRFFFWSYPQILTMPPYEQVAFQAIVFLQSMYGFVVLDYNYQASVYCRGAAHSIAAVADDLVYLFGSVSPQSVLPGSFFSSC